MPRSWRRLAALLVFNIFATASAQAQQAPDGQSRPPEAVHGLQGVVLKLVPPPGLCRVDPVKDRDLFETMAGLLEGKMLAVWLGCPDLRRIETGEGGEPERWMYLVAQRDSKGRVVPFESVTREEAFGRWADAWSKAGAAGSGAEQSLARAKARLRSKLGLDLNSGLPQIVGPDEVAIYLATMAESGEPGTSKTTRIAGISGWSMILNHRVGIAEYENDSGPERLPQILENVRNTMLSLDRLSVMAGAN